LATVPGPDAVDSGSNEQAAADLRFQRLERVRAQRRSRRQRRLILISVLVLATAGVCALGLTAIRRASPERPGATSAHVPVGAVTLPEVPVPPPPTVLAPTPPAVAAPPSTSAPTRALSPTPIEGAKPDAVVPRRTQPQAPPARDVTPPTNRLTGAPALQHGEATGSEPEDGTAAIDWLLKTSRTKDQ
jgi:hypothetical protein